MNSLAESRGGHEVSFVAKEPQTIDNLCKRESQFSLPGLLLAGRQNSSVIYPLTNMESINFNGWV